MYAYIRSVSFECIFSKSISKAFYAIHFGFILLFEMLSWQVSEICNNLSPRKILLENIPFAKWVLSSFVDGRCMARNRIIRLLNFLLVKNLTLTRVFECDVFWSTCVNVIQSKCRADKNKKYCVQWGRNRKWSWTWANNKATRCNCINLLLFSFFSRTFIICCETCFWRFSR